MAKEYLFQRIRSDLAESGYFHEVGIFADGSLRNPRGYPQDVLRTALEAAIERKRVRRSNAAKKAGETRARRQEKRVYDTAKRIVEGHHTGPSESCCICGRGLSIQRGIGSECWQGVLAICERLKTEAA